MTTARKIFGWLDMMKNTGEDFRETGDSGNKNKETGEEC